MLDLKDRSILQRTHRRGVWGPLLPFSNTVNLLLTLLRPPFSNKSSPSNKPLFRERVLISLSPPIPSPNYSSLIINRDCKTSCGLTWDGLVRIWFWPSAVWPNTFCTWAFPLSILVLYRELILSSFLNWISPPSLLSSPVKWAWNK